MSSNKLNTLVTIATMLAMASSPETNQHFRTEGPIKPIKEKPPKFCKTCINGNGKSYCKLMNKSINRITPACVNYYNPN